MSQWAEIPDELLELIAEKLSDFEDILVLGLICKPWRAGAVRCKENFMKKQTQQPPWLMLPPSKRRHRRGFYSLTTRRNHQIPLWESNGKKCYSSRGWLLTVGSDWGMHLLNPMTLARIELPGIKSFGESSYAALSKPCVQFISRVVLSANPSLAPNFVLVVIKGFPSMPAYWRPGDNRWTMIEYTERVFADAVFHQDKCYFITFLGKLLVTDFGMSNPTTAKFITEFPKNIIEGYFCETLYLVTLKTTLLLVLRERSGFWGRGKKFRNRPYQTIYFQVFKLDFKSLSWEEMKSLASWSLFLGQNSSIALNATMVKGCKPNSIYFTDDNTDFSHFTREEACFDMGIFDMNYRKIEPLIEGSWRNRVSPPIFVDQTF